MSEILDSKRQYLVHIAAAYKSEDKPRLGPRNESLDVVMTDRSTTELLFNITRQEGIVYVLDSRLLHSFAGFIVVLQIMVLQIRESSSPLSLPLRNVTVAIYEDDNSLTSSINGSQYNQRTKGNTNNIEIKFTQSQPSV